MDQSDYNQFLDVVYDSAVDPGAWPQVLRRFAELTGAESALLIQQDEQIGKGQAIRVNVDPDAAEPYYGHFATRNVLHNTKDPVETLRKWCSNAAWATCQPAWPFAEGRRNATRPFSA
ncbi:hypothetical protein [Phenylobacterium sp.]|uniref:hypothetical protein n=1 Tax=Phenylobacterium sp. TaxID=1871053 RepID=UPI00121C660F|nr:hypothetical protein [Phenylobacterium sp.]THD57476.1 MAG: hypothetical protein E8A49_22815 [Phenylobacterium sp.]